MMRIGYDAKRYFLNRTGLGNYSRDLIRILETYYPENEYLKYSPKVKPEYINQVPDWQLKNKVPLGFWNKSFPSLWRNRWIVQDLRRDNIDLFHGLSGEIPVGLKQTNIKSIVTIHDLIYLRYPELYKPLDRWIYNKKSLHAVQEADKIIAISQQTKQDIMQFYQIPANKIEVIYQGCHPAFQIQRTEEEKQQLREKYKLPQQFILNVGSIEPRKNAFQIVKAIAHMDIPLLIIGKMTPYAEQINKYIAEKNLGNRILLRQGFSMDELATIYSMATIFVYPSKFEGFGIPIIEALYAGTPVITNQKGVFPEAGGPFSYYIDPENIDNLSYAIETVLNSTGIQAEMRTKGLAYAQQFNDDRIAKQLIDCYTSL
ncbi:glycosyltransferase family 4 protein [Sphingobacterium sp. HJSM2_6]|uniref:glycosyltransferase family 4 protein n=1 Tax=Sphingobacterium sp. HJSM2_6 TaxID=3366264 RepID=UPI003BC16786